MTHLTADELVDALDHALEPSRETHLGACQPCQQQLSNLGAVLNRARGVDVPEPSPLYWQHLSARVRTAIDAEPVVGDGWRRWLRWPVLAPIGALALIVAALPVTLSREATVDREIVASEPLGGSLDDRFDIVADLVGDIDWDTAVSAGLTVAPGAADLALLELTATEQRELWRLLQAELTRAKS